MKRNPKTITLGITATIILLHIILYSSVTGKFTPGDYSTFDLLLTFTSIVCIVAIAWYISVLLPKSTVTTNDEEETPKIPTIYDSIGVSSTTWVDNETHKYSKPASQEDVVNHMLQQPGGTQRINSVRDAFNLSK